MANQEPSTSTGVENYGFRLRTRNDVDYSYRKRKIRYPNPYAKVTQGKKSKVHIMTTTKNVNHSASKRKMNFVNPYAVGSKRKKVEAYQSRSKNENSNDDLAIVDASIPIKKEDSYYRFRSRKVVNYSLTKRRSNSALSTIEQFKTEKIDDTPIKSEPNVAESSSSEIDISIKTVAPEIDVKPIKTMVDDWEPSDDLPLAKLIEESLRDEKPAVSKVITFLNSVEIQHDLCQISPEKSIKSSDDEREPSDDLPLVKLTEENSHDENPFVFEVKPLDLIHSNSVEIQHDLSQISPEKTHSCSVKSELVYMNNPDLKVKVESLEVSAFKAAKSENVTKTDSPFDEEVEDACDDVQFVPKPVTIITIDDDDETDKPSTFSEEVKSETEMDIDLKTETKIALDDMPRGDTESDQLSNSESEDDEPKTLELFEEEWEEVDELLDILNMTESIESLFRDRNVLEVPNFNFLNEQYLIRCGWELENKYRQFEIYSFDGLENEVGGIEGLTEEQLEHPYYKNHQPKPELTEEEKEEIELEKDRKCEEASGFQNHLWRRPLNGGPFAQTSNPTPIPRCPEYIHAFTPAGQHVAMKTDADRPPKFRTDWDRRLWDFATIFNFNRYRDDIEEGHYLPVSADGELENKVLKANDEFLQECRSRRRELLPFEKMLLLNEMKILYWDRCVKTCLPHLEKLALCLMDEILEAPIYLFTMIKYFFIFLTIKKVMQQKQYPALKEKAILLYEKIEDTAILKDGETLEDHIISRSELLHKHYEDASLYDLVRLNARTATRSIAKHLNDIVEGNEDKQVRLLQNEQYLLLMRALKCDSGELIAMDGGSSSDEDGEGSESDEREDEEDDDGYSGTYDEVGSTSSSLSFDSDSDLGDFFFGNDEEDSSSSSSEDEALMDDIIREE